jgi:NADH dehydrogenase
VHAINRKADDVDLNARSDSRLEKLDYRAMNRHRRRALVGASAGLIASVILAWTLGHALLGVILGVLVGAILVSVYRPADRAPIDSLMEAAALAVPLWSLVDVIALPLAAGESPRWTAAEMQREFPALEGWMLFLVVLGLLAHAADKIAARIFGPEREPARPALPVRKHIVILGGGFAGVSTAEHLERLFGADASIAITLVSETNALLFTPMLAEVAASSLEATHISSPLRTGLRRTEVLRGRVDAIDLARKKVTLARDAASGPRDLARKSVTAAGSAASGTRELAYDQLVIALGSVSNYLGLANVQANAFDFKTLSDAIRIRNHVIDCFERADREIDPVERRRLVTFVIAGGGFAGAELTGGINDFARGMLAYYPNVPRDDVRVVLVHGGERILNELSEPLALYAQQRMAERGVTFRLKTRLKDASPGVVVLSDGEIEAATLVWTAGTAPNPLLKTLGVEIDKRGAAVTDATLRVKGFADVWAIGDAAAIPDVLTGKNCPPTAQFAIREARQLARNLHATMRGRAPQAFRFAPLGALCVVGHHTACAEIKGLRFSGLLAWLMWRGIYLGKLPSAERKVRVLVDWTIELFFPRDIVQTIDLGAQTRT